MVHSGIICFTLKFSGTYTLQLSSINHSSIIPHAHEGLQSLPFQRRILSSGGVGVEGVLPWWSSG